MQYMTSVLLGDVFGRLFLHVIGVAQRVYQAPVCELSTLLQELNATKSLGRPHSSYNRYHHYSTTPAPTALPPQLRFTVAVSFFLGAAVICVRYIFIIKLYGKLKKHN